MVAAVLIDRIPRGLSNMSSSCIVLITVVSADSSGGELTHNRVAGAISRYYFDPHLPAEA